MSKPNVYPDETDAKRLARLAVYRRVQALQTSDVRAGNSFVVLAGPWAGDLGALRHMMQSDPRATFFVDNEEKRGLRFVEKEWPSVKTVNGDVADVLPSLKPKAALINLDFCGYLNKGREEIVIRSAQALVEWGLIFYTFFRGREDSKTQNWERVLQAKAKTLEGKRLIGNAQIMQKALGPSFLPVFSLRYTGVNNVGPRKVKLGNMAILGFQKVPKTFQRNSHWLRMLAVPSPYGGRVPSDRRLLQEHLRVEALHLRAQGLNSSQVGAVLNLSQGTVAAWFANQYRR